MTWAEHGDRKFAVEAFRCLACASSELVERDWNTEHEKDKPTKGAYSPGDGRTFVARPAKED